MKLNLTGSVSLLLLAISPVSSLAIAPSESIELYTKDVIPRCGSEYHPCSIFSEFETCSPKWLKWIGKCGATGCMQWFRDPTADCRKKPVETAEA